MEWSPLARGYALAWQQDQRETCSRCGTRQDEWHADREAYVPATHYCQGDALLDQQTGTFPTDDTGRPAPGFKPYLKPKAQAEAELEAEALRQMAAEQAANSTDDRRE